VFKVQELSSVAVDEYFEFNLG
jgi:hypothetical protein